MTIKDNIMECLSDAALDCIVREQPLELHPMIFAAVMACDNPNLTLILRVKNVGEEDL